MSSQAKRDAYDGATDIKLLPTSFFEILLGLLFDSRVFEGLPKHESFVTGKMRRPVRYPRNERYVAVCQSRQSLGCCIRRLALY